MSSPETVLQNKDTSIGADLYLSFELGDKRTVANFAERPVAVGRAFPL
jgi:hypothetical protein